MSLALLFLYLMLDMFRMYSTIKMMYGPINIRLICCVFYYHTHFRKHVSSASNLKENGHLCKDNTFFLVTGG